MSTENRPITPAREKLPGEKLILPGSTVGGEVGTFYVDFTFCGTRKEAHPEA